MGLAKFKFITNTNRVLGMLHYFRPYFETQSILCPMYKR
jgi:hypothetical protein